MSDTTPVCTTCEKTAAAANVPNLQKCSRCKQANYCSRECQKADWKMHKRACAQTQTPGTESAANTSSSTAHLKGIKKPIPKPFTCLDNGTYLHERPETDVYKLLIDCFRLRQDDDHWLENKTTPGSIYTGAESSMDPFRKFLTLAASRQNLLPEWWGDAKQQECEAFGTSQNWSNLRKKAGKQDIIGHYGDDNMPMQLRMLGEQVYGTGPGGQSSVGMRAAMMQMERGGFPDGYHVSRQSLR